MHLPIENAPDQPAWYALRRTLPTWSFDENLHELVTQLPVYQVDELIVKIDTEEFTHGQPPLDWVTAYQQNLFRIKEALAKIGVTYSINPWITVGHNDRGRDAMAQLPGLQTVVGHDGTKCICCACPLSEVWREHVAKVWKLYAETEPHVIWVEDDIRTFNHGPVRYGCFCPLHLERFAGKVGRTVSRAELVDALMQPGEVHPWRQLFLDMQAEIMVETVAFLAEIVHLTSPQTCLGLMSSGPRTHCLEGRRWYPFATALADGQPLYSRPPMSNYHESSLRGFYYSHDSIKLTRHCLPPQTIEQTEVENVPFTQYSKSVVFTFLEMAVSFAYGSHGVTMNLYDHCGTPMQREPAYGVMLAEKKPFLSALAAKARQPGKYAGVQLLFHEQTSYFKRLQPTSDYRGLEAPGYAMMEMLEAHGIPTTYEASNVVAAQGQLLRAFDDSAVTAMLQQGLFLDAEAAMVLFERGFGADIGVESMQAPRLIDELGAFSAEEFFHPEFGGSRNKFLTLTVPGLGGRPWLSRMIPSDAATIISHVVNPDAEPSFPCMIACENRYGGRVVIHALDWERAHGVAFNHTFRAEQLQHAMRWLAHGRPSLMVRGDGVYPLTFRKDLEDGTSLVGLFNLSLDDWTEMHLELAAPATLKKIEYLEESGRWLDMQDYQIAENDGVMILSLHRSLPFDHPLFMILHWA